MKKRNIIRSQKVLINYFKDSSLRMKKNTVISFQDNIKLGSNILFEGKIILGKNNKIHSNCILKNVILGDNNLIKMSSYIENTNIKNNNLIGPFAYLRDNTKINNNCIIAAYVEVTRSLINNKTFISHRAFIGDASIGHNTIIGAGVVFCNYNFKTNSKARSTVGKNCKIGSNSTIIAPAHIMPSTIIPAATKFKN
jgi:bifunctional UDP-N-acetylglucosamine pyrophosphorylase/glucosamine-1-phosphate N-acetyltransferase